MKSLPRGLIAPRHVYSPGRPWGLKWRVHVVEQQRDGVICTVEARNVSTESRTSEIPSSMISIARKADLSMKSAVFRK